MSLRRALIVAVAGFMLAAGLAVAVVAMAIPPWVYGGISKDCLREQVALTEAEAAPIPSICPGLPMLQIGPRLQNEWRAFLARMQEGDELWTFCTPPVTWEHMTGRGGVALVRHGKVAGTFVTVLQ